MSTLTQNDLAMTDIDAAILFRLADKQARVRPHWFESLLTDPNQRHWRAVHMAQNLSMRLMSADRGAIRTAHYADVQRIADADRLLRADWLPATIAEYLPE